MAIVKTRACLIGGLLLCVTAAWPAEPLSGFRPSATPSDYGTTSEIEFSTGLLELESGVLAYYVPQAMKSFQFEEPVWVIGYKSDILDIKGQPPRGNFLCHTFFADQRVAQHEDAELKGIYSDAFTPEIRLPDGFGIRVLPNEPLHWMPMFNNRSEDAVRVKMRVVLTVIRGKDLKKPLKPLYGGLRSVQVPHLYFVPPGRDEKQITFELPFNGRIHFLGTHVHPYGVSVELYNVSRNETVWKGTRKSGTEGPMNVYSSADGYAFRAGETYRIAAVYNNPTKEKIDAMAGLFLLYTRD
jgi:hypothetical protein